MLDLTNYLIANPLVAAGLGILALLVLHNLRRGQPRIAIGMALLIFVTVFYISRQILTDEDAPPGFDREAIQNLTPPEPPE
ncbi:MAG: hypothetical protein HN712_10780 [Gemmatimonadetes bacterium]|jgi:hypothetical protein|nr:hypothetical protein [Gemmatimonadota bacterium]MBT6148633.1 hypothetical protein [Gemmatimonadota bacterium]MBT7860789.1 hypothetical protein [Gemmatimonadota bacterium]